MRKTTITLVVGLAFMLTAATMQAQSSNITVGGGLAYVTDLNTAGLFTIANFSRSEEWEVQAAINYFLPKKIEGHQGNNITTNWLSFDIDTHYKAELDPIILYVLLGINYQMVKSKFDSYTVGGTKIEETTSSSGNLGINLGMGSRYSLNEKLSIIGEVKYVVGLSFIQFDLGVALKL